MFRPHIDNLLLQGLEVKNEPQKHMHFNHVLTEHDFLELRERQLIKPETDQVREYRKQRGVVLAIGHGGVQLENHVIRGLEEPLVPFNAVEHLFKEHPLSVFALEGGEELGGVRIWGHYVFVEGVN